MKSKYLSGRIKRILKGQFPWKNNLVAKKSLFVIMLVAAGGHLE